MKQCRFRHSGSMIMATMDSGGDVGASMLPGYLIEALTDAELAARAGCS